MASVVPCFGKCQESPISDNISHHPSNSFATTRGVSYGIIIRPNQTLRHYALSLSLLLNHHWLVVSTHLKNISQNGNLPQIGVKIKDIWNHHLDQPKPLSSSTKMSCPQILQFLPFLPSENPVRPTSGTKKITGSTPRPRPPLQSHHHNHLQDPPLKTEQSMALACQSSYKRHEKLTKWFFLDSLWSEVFYHFQHLNQVNLGNIKQKHTLKKGEKPRNLALLVVFLVKSPDVIFDVQLPSPSAAIFNLIILIWIRQLRHWVQSRCLPTRRLAPQMFVLSGPCFGISVGRFSTRKLGSPWFQGIFQWLHVCMMCIIRTPLGVSHCIPDSESSEVLKSFQRNPRNKKIRKWTDCVFDSHHALNRNKAWRFSLLKYNIKQDFRLLDHCHCKSACQIKSPPKKNWRLWNCCAKESPRLFSLLASFQSLNPPPQCQSGHGLGILYFEISGPLIAIRMFPKIVVPPNHPF